MEKLEQRALLEIAKYAPKIYFSLELVTSRMRSKLFGDVATCLTFFESSFQINTASLYIPQAKQMIRKLYVSKRYRAYDFRGRTIMQFDLQTKEWERLYSQVQVDLKDGSWTKWQNGVIYTGGRHLMKEEELRTAYYFELYDQVQVFNMPPMNDKRASHGIVRLKSDVYVIGGSTNRRITNVCEVLRGQEWIKIAKMIKPKFFLSVTGYRGQIWVLIKNQAAIDTYNPNTDKWTDLKIRGIDTPMLLFRNSASDTLQIIDMRGQNFRGCAYSPGSEKFEWVQV